MYINIGRSPIRVFLNQVCALSYAIILPWSQSIESQGVVIISSRRIHRSFSEDFRRHTVGRKIPVCFVKLVYFVQFDCLSFRKSAGGFTSEVDIGFESTDD